MTLDSYKAPALSVLRIVSSLAFLEHGTGKFLGFPVLPHLPAVFSMPWWGGLVELIGGGLLAVGLFSRPAAFLMSGEMAVAYWTVHIRRSFFPVLNGGDAAVLFCFIFLYIFAAGPGPWSLDALRSR